MKSMKVLSGVALAAALAFAGCSSDNSAADAPSGGGPDAKPAGGPDAGGTGFPQPSGTVAVNFTVDDTANKVYAAGDLEWKGSHVYEPATRKIIAADSNWGGPFPPLYDDGPWTSGGHEPIGNVAGDHKWGVTVFVAPPATGMQKYEYGLNDTVYQTKYGNGWAWPSPDNGSYTINAGATAAVTAPGVSLPAFGTTDLQVVIDTTKLDTATAWDTSKVQIKGSAWDWGLVNLTVTSGKATFTLSGVVGSGKPYNHSGLLNTGDKPQFVVVLGAGDGKEYKDADGNALATGVTAGTKTSSASAFSNASITLVNKNSSITVP
jgi:hypothetical protein